MLTSALALALLTALTVGFGQAQGPAPENERPPEEAAGPAGVADIVIGDIPVQGRLTGADGSPVPDGNYTITFRLYDVEVGGDPLCLDTDHPLVTNGLFTTLMGYCTADDINGRELWLGVQVEGDEEMLPRQQIAPVPYAWSLRPGAVIAGQVAGDSVLHVFNGSTTNNSRGVHALAYGLTGTNYAVYGESYSANGYGGYFASTTYSGDGVALKAGGSGIIQSTARSYLWISGNGLQKGNSDDTTRFVYDQYGGYKVYSGADLSNKGVVLPVTIPGQLYGQDVTVTGLDLYYAIGGEFAVIDRVVMYRQDGAGAGDQILRDLNDLSCAARAQCSKHWDLSQNNVLSDSQGIVYLALGLGFSDQISYVHIGGVRLTLDHD